MCVVLGEAPDTHQTMQYAAAFVPIDRPEFSVANRKITIGPLARLVDADMSGAIHRLGTISHALDVHRSEHVLLEILEVSGDLEKSLVHDVRGVHQLITVTKDERALVFLDLVANDRAFWMPEDQPWTNPRIGRVKIELLGQRPVVAPLRLLELMQVRL